MKALLMDREQDFDLARDLPASAAALTQDLELTTLYNAMALGDKFLFDVAMKAVLLSLTDPAAILYRQQVLADCLAQPAVVRFIYDLAVGAIQDEKKVHFGWMRGSPDAVLHRAVQVLELFVGVLKDLRQIADEHAGKFRSEGFARFFAMLKRELDDDYFSIVEEHLRALRLRRGVLISAELGTGNKGRNYVLRRLPEESWLERLALKSRPGYTFHIPDRDENGFKALADLQGRGVNGVANALAQAADHILGFFSTVRTELAFYVGCLNLEGRLATKGEPLCFPVPVAPGRVVLTARGLYDVSLALHLPSRVVGNDVEADGKSLVMITGANQGGKSTFLRSVGLAQVMMQAGMFVGAASFSADIRCGIVTHYKREEDTSMTSGKFDEELRRMSEIAANISPNSLLLFNESFQATNEREGSEIARQVVRALTEAGVKIVFVTHLFDLAHGLYRQGSDAALFLRAERQAGGGRTFRVVAGEPLPTSFGADSYRRIFGVAPDAA